MNKKNLKQEGRQDHFNIPLLRPKSSGLIVFGHLITESNSDWKFQQHFSKTKTIESSLNRRLQQTKHRTHGSRKYQFFIEWHEENGTLSNSLITIHFFSFLFSFYDHSFFVLFVRSDSRILLILNWYLIVFYFFFFFRYFHNNYHPFGLGIRRMCTYMYITLIVIAIQSKSRYNCCWAITTQQKQNKLDKFYSFVFINKEFPFSILKCSTFSVSRQSAIIIAMLHYKRQEPEHSIILT